MNAHRTRAEIKALLQAHVDQLRAERVTAARAAVVALREAGTEVDPTMTIEAAHEAMHQIHTVPQPV